MVEVIWTDNALQDLNVIGDYIAKDSVRYAEITVSKLFSRVDILERNPLSGSLVPEFNYNSIRQLICGNYRIIYKIIDPYRVEILTIHNSARLLGQI